MLSRRCIFSTAVFFGALLYYSLPLNTPFFTRGEAREALVVQAMFDQHNLILPLRNGADIPSKPPFFHWAAYTLSALCGGMSEFFIRFPSALASALLLGALFYLFSARVSEKAAGIAVLLLGSSFDWMRSSIVARVDLVFTLWVTLATWILFLGLEEKRRKTQTDWKLFALAGCCMGFAALTKGPAGIAFPGAVAGLYALFIFKKRELPIRPAFFSAGIAVAIAALWYLAAYHEGGKKFFDVLFIRENMARLVAMDDYEVGHESGPFTVFPLVIAGLLPWSFFLAAGIPLAWAKRRSLGKDREVLFCLLWAAFYLVFFACTTSKRNVYMLPSYPAYAYLFARGIDELAFSRTRGMRVVNWLFRIFTATLAVLLFVLVNMRWFDLRGPLAALKVKPQDIETVISLGSPNYPTLFGIALAVLLSALGTWALSKNKVIRAVVQLAAGQLLLAMSINFGVMTRIAAIQSPKEELPQLVSALPSFAEVYQYHQDFYAVNYYLRRNVPTLQNAAELTKTANQYIFVADSELPAARRIFGELTEISRSSGRILYGKDRLVLLKIS